MNQLNQAKRSKYNIACLMIDLDHFKKVNDTYGHEVGDMILQESSRIVGSQLRRSDVIVRVDTDFGNGNEGNIDVCVRYGGEEFVALLPYCDLAGGLISAERIRKAVAEITIPGTDNHISCSIGVAEFNYGNPADPEALLREADRQLYLAKDSGRNCIMPAVK